MKLNNTGQALITLLVFTVIAVTIIGAAVTITLINTETSSAYDQSTQAYYLAEAGAENAILSYVRDKNYNGETLEIGNGTATITIKALDYTTIISVGQVGQYKRTIEVIGRLQDNEFTITSWADI